jgi:hypothetical protein
MTSQLLSKSVLQQEPEDASLKYAVHQLTQTPPNEVEQATLSSEQTETTEKPHTRAMSESEVEGRRSETDIQVVRETIEKSRYESEGEQEKVTETVTEHIDATDFEKDRRADSQEVCLSEKERVALARRFVMTIERLSGRFQGSQGVSEALGMLLQGLLKMLQEGGPSLNHTERIQRRQIEESFQMLMENLAQGHSLTPLKKAAKAMRNHLERDRKLSEIFHRFNEFLTRLFKEPESDQDLVFNFADVILAARRHLFRYYPDTTWALISELGAYVDQLLSDEITNEYVDAFERVEKDLITERYIQ